jgi:hypothetical protein
VDNFVDIYACPLPKARKTRLWTICTKKKQTVKPIQINDLQIFRKFFEDAKENLILVHAVYFFVHKLHGGTLIFVVFEVSGRFLG